MNPTDPPRVANVAVARLHPDHDADRMASRYLYPEDSDVWTADQRAAIAKFKRDFKPQWTPPRESYSDWHYMLLIPAKQPDQHFARPVVILMNAKCFSATDVFLSALKGLPNVTLLGTASGGGSANANLIPLGGSDLRVRLATMISFQRDGRLFDGNGVQPDIIVEPTSEFFIGGRDNQLDAAIGIIEKKSGVSNAGL